MVYLELERMPKSCGECGLCMNVNNLCAYCMATGYQIKYSELDMRDYSCPIREESVISANSALRSAFGLSNTFQWKDVYSDEEQSDPDKEYLMYSNGKYEIGSYYIDASYDNVAYWHDRDGEIINADYYAELPEPPKEVHHDEN